MLRLQGNEVIYINSENLGAIENLQHTGEGFSICLPDGSMVFIPEEDATPEEAEVFRAYHEFYADTGGLPPAPPASLEQLKQLETDNIKTACNAEILAGFDSDAHGSLVHYGLDYEDQLNMEALKNNISLGIIREGDLEYYAKGKPCEAWTNAQFLQLYDEAMNFKNVRIRRAKQLISQIEAAVSAEEVELITW